jgi:hypothetical protein
MRKLIIQSEANDDMLKMLPALLSSASREPQRFWPTPILAPEWGLFFSGASALTFNPPCAFGA